MTAGVFPHGNSAASSSRNYVQTQPHVIRDIQQASGSARSIYQNLVLSGPASISQQTTATPRNMEQVRNTQKGQRNRCRLTRDALYKLHEFAADSDFINKIVTHPDLHIIMYSRAAIDLFIDLSSRNEDHPVQTLSYDNILLLITVEGTWCTGSVRPAVGYVTRPLSVNGRRERRRVLTWAESACKTARDDLYSSHEAVAGLGVSVALVVDVRI